MQHNISLDTQSCKQNEYVVLQIPSLFYSSITMHPTETHTHTNKHNRTIVNNFIIEDCPEDLRKKRSNKQKEST